MSHTIIKRPKNPKHKNKRVGRFDVINVSNQKWHVVDLNGNVLDTATFRYDAIRKATALEKAAANLEGMPKVERNKRLAFFEFNYIK